MPYGLFVPDVNVEYPPTMRAPAAFGVWGEFFMDKLFEALMPRLPPWLIPPGAIVVLLILAWPVLSEIWIVVIPSYRRYAREKRRLELLKLYYEIEAIKKTNQLSELPLVSADNLTQSARTTRNVVDEITRPQEKQVAAISNAQKFIFGCFGGAVILPISAAVAFAATATPGGEERLLLWEVLLAKAIVALITSTLFSAVLFRRRDSTNNQSQDAGRRVRPWVTSTASRCAVFQLGRLPCRLAPRKDAPSSPLAPELRLRRGLFFYRTGGPASAMASSGRGCQREIPRLSIRRSNLAARPLPRRLAMQGISASRQGGKRIERTWQSQTATNAASNRPRCSMSC